MRGSVRSGLPARRATSLLVVLIAALGSLVATSAPSQAEVTAVTGEAFGYDARDITLFGGTQQDTAEPTPQVSLNPDASNSPQSASQAEGELIYGPATVFTSGEITVSTEGSLGDGGSVSTSASLDNVNRSGDEVFGADNLSASCTADESGVSGSTSVTNGIVRNHAQGPQLEPPHDEELIPTPTNPEPNHAVEGHLHVNNAVDNFVIVFNEQTVNADGSITVTAAHYYFGATLNSQGEIVDDPYDGGAGSTLQGDLYLGQVTCGVEATTTTTTTTTPPGTTTTTTPSGTTTTTTPSGTTTTTTPSGTTTTTTRPATATTPASAGGLAGRAYGYFAEVSLFGGPAEQRGPEPIVVLEPDGSNSPQHAHVDSAQAVYGPATLFVSRDIDVHTEAGSVTSSVSIQGPADADQVDPIHYGAMESGCTANDDGTLDGSATISDAQLVTVSGTRSIPSDPEPNLTMRGKVPNVEDDFRVVFNEQTVDDDGTLTVNAAHMYLEGPTAVGELIIGQSVCGLNASTDDAGDDNAGGTNTGTDSQAISGGGSSTDGQLASTGSRPLPAATASLVLIVLGYIAIRLSGRPAEDATEPGH